MRIPMSRAEMVDAFATELAGVVGALAGASVSAEAADALPSEGGYRIVIVPEDGGSGALHVQIDREGARALAQFALGASEDLPELDLRDGMRDMCGQAAASVVERRQMTGVRVVVQSIEPATEPAPADAVLKRIVPPDGNPPTVVALWGSLELGVDTTVPTPAALANPAVAASRTASLGGPDLDAILDLELPVIVRFGRAELTLKDLALLAPGAVIDLGRSPDDPVEVLVSNQVVARGEVVTVSGNYGVRITDVIGAADRIRYMELAS